MTADPPKITNNVSIMKWSEAMSDHLSLRIGIMMIPLSYVVRKKVEMDHVLPPKSEGNPHSTKYSSVESDMIHLASHDNPWCREDNSKVGNILKKYKIGNMYTSIIKPFQKREDGRAAFMSIMFQHTGPDKWTTLLQACGSYLHTGKWKSNNNFPYQGVCLNNVRVTWR